MRLLNLHIKTSMTHELDIPRRSPAEPHAAQYSHQRMTGWHSQTTQSLGTDAYARQSNGQAATPSQQSPARNVGTPVENVSNLVFTHCPFYVWQDLSILSGTTSQSSPPSPVMSVGDASLIDTTSVRKGPGSKKAPSAKGPCPFPKCGKGYPRPQELERHICEHHLPNHIHCEQPGCDWTGDRRYALKNHLSDKHTGAPVPGVEGYMIYDAKGLVKRLMTRGINVGQVEGEARSLFQKRAVALGKLGIWKGACVPTSLGVL